MFGTTRHNIYTPPKRNWAYDANFDDPTKLPPKTPSLLKVIRGQWATVRSRPKYGAVIPWPAEKFAGPVEFHA